MDWKRVTRTEEFRLTKGGRIKESRENYIKQKEDKEREEEEECNKRVVLRGVPVSTKKLLLGDIEEYKEKRRKEQKVTVGVDYGFNEKDRVNREERRKRE